MITILVKWLSGDLVSVEVPKGTKIYELAAKVTGEPLCKVSFFREEETLPHHYCLTEDDTLGIVVSDVRSVLVYESLGKVYYTSDMTSIHRFSLGKVQEFDHIYVDYLSFSAYFCDKKREELCEKLLQMSPREHMSIDLRYFKDSFLARRMGDDIRLLWRDFMKGFSLLLSENMEKFCFPTLTQEIKRLPLTPRQWSTYCVLQK